MLSLIRWAVVSFDSDFRPLGKMVIGKRDENVIVKPSRQVATFGEF